MDSTFQYNKPVTGKQFIGRKAELRAFANLLGQGENVVIYEPPKTGRRSLVQQGFFFMRSSGQRFEPVQLTLLDVRTLSAFALRLASSAIRSLGNGPADYARAVEEYLSGTHFVFDAARYDAVGEVLSACLEKGVIVLSAHDKVRLLPPLSIPMEQLKKAIEVLKEVISNA